MLPQGLALMYLGASENALSAERAEEMPDNLAESLLGCVETDLNLGPMEWIDFGRRLCLGTLTWAREHQTEEYLLWPIDQAGEALCGRVRSVPGVIDVSHALDRPRSWRANWLGNLSHR